MESIDGNIIQNILKHLSKNDVKSLSQSSKCFNNKLKRECGCYVLDDLLSYEFLDCIDIISELTIYEIISCFEIDHYWIRGSNLKYKYPKKNGWSRALDLRYKHLRYLNISPY